MMMRRTILYGAHRLRSCYLLTIRHSALFINGLKATNTYVHVTPHTNFPQCDKNEIRSNLSNRKSNLNLDKVENLWSLYEDIKKLKEDLEKAKFVVSSELLNLIKTNPSDRSIEQLKIKLGLLKENIKKLKVPLWSAQEAAMVELLKVPNNLHPQTPCTSDQVIFTFNNCPSNDKNHLEIATNNDLIQFTDNENYYLKGDAAIFELGAKFYFSKLLKNNHFIQFSNPDFVKSLVIEGCGYDHTNPDHTFIIHHNEDSKVSVDNRLHLTGGSSLFSFMAFYTKNLLYNKVLPLKYFSMGRQYVPAQSKTTGLFNVCQSSTVSTFAVTRNSEECDEILNNIIELTKTVYSQLGYHYRLRIVSADKLHMAESLRIAIEMYSCSLKSYVEIGNISVSGDFISKRLLFMYTDEKQMKFPHIISGTILNVPKLLGCILEEDRDFYLPQEFEISNWNI